LLITAIIVFLQIRNKPQEDIKTDTESITKEDLSDLHQEYGSKVNFISVNIELYPSIAKDYSVSAIPTLLFFKDKQLVSRSIGVVTKGKIKEYLNTLIEQ